jgi:hypothetical protein
VLPPWQANPGKMGKMGAMSRRPAEKASDFPVCL